MLQISKPRPLTDSGAAAPELISPAELYAAVIGFVRRRFPVIALTVVLMLAPLLDTVPSHEARR